MRLCSTQQGCQLLGLLWELPSCGPLDSLPHDMWLGPVVAPGHQGWCHAGDGNERRLISVQDRWVTPKKDQEGRQTGT